MKEIKLTNSDLVALVDNEDYKLISGFKWRLRQNRKEKTKYAEAWIGYCMIKMHRLILQLEQNDGIKTDHRNHNGLDNRRQNLRPCTDQQNTYNTRKKVGMSSRFKGVYWDKEKQAWRAQIRIEKVKTHLGYYAVERAAGMVYNCAALLHFGDFAVLNCI